MCGWHIKIKSPSSVSIMREKRAGYGNADAGMCFSLPWKEKLVKCRRYLYTRELSLSYRLAISFFDTVITLTIVASLIPHNLPILNGLFLSLFYIDDITRERSTIVSTIRNRRMVTISPRFYIRLVCILLSTIYIVLND